MGNTLYITLFAILIIVAFVVYLFARTKKDPVGKVIAMFLLASDHALLLYVLATFIPNPLVSQVIFSFFFCANTFVTYSIFRFANVYNRVTPPKAFFYVAYFFIVLDTVSLLLNIKFHHIATFEFVTVGNFSGWVFTHKVPFYMHLLLCYLFAMGFFGLMITRSIRAPKLYKTKYYTIIIIALSGMLFNYIFLKQHFIFDWIVIWYVLLGMFLYLYTYIILPKELGLHAGKQLLAGMNTAVLLYDQIGESIYHNKAAEKYILNAKANETLSEFALRFGFDPEKTDEKQELVSYGEESAYYDLETCPFLDSKGRLEGTYVLIDDTTAEHAAMEERLFNISHDMLTGLLNAGAFSEAAKKLLIRHPKIEYSIITTNIKQFKILNDVVGRNTGDELLKKLASILHALPYQDIACARMGGDRFAVICPSGYAIEKELEEQITKAFDEFRASHNLSLALVNYFGIYPISEQDIEQNLSIEDMCDRANLAILSLKGDITRRLAYYDSHLKEEMIWESELLSEIPSALKNEEFVIYYQPQIDSFTNKIVGAEALVRWNHPTHGLLAPGRFIPLLEKMGLIFKLDLYVWNHAAKDLKLLRDEGYDIAISVNISPRDVFAGDIRKIFSEIVEKNGLPPSALRLEITETAVSLDPDKFIGTIADLQRKGFTMEMDDFGSGYSSLNVLKDIPIDVLKMDMRFLDDSANEGKGKKIMKIISDLACSLEVPLIAEGVEQKNQVDFLADIGCRNLQGYFYSKPIPLEKFRALLDSYELGELL